MKRSQRRCRRPRHTKEARAARAAEREYQRAVLVRYRQATHAAQEAPRCRNTKLVLQTWLFDVYDPPVEPPPVTTRVRPRGTYTRSLLFTHDYVPSRP